MESPFTPMPRSCDEEPVPAQLLGWVCRKGTRRHYTELEGEAKHYATRGYKVRPVWDGPNVPGVDARGDISLRMQADAWMAVYDLLQRNLKALPNLALDDYTGQGFALGIITYLFAHRPPEKEVVEQALAALEQNHEWHQTYDEHGGYPDSQLEEANVAAIGALKQELMK